MSELEGHAQIRRQLLEHPGQPTSVLAERRRQHPLRQLPDHLGDRRLHVLRGGVV